MSTRENASSHPRRGPAAPPSQLFKTTPPGNPTRPNGSPFKPCLTTHDRTVGSLPPMRAASASLSCPAIAPQYVHTCFTRFLTGTVKATWTPLPIGQTHRRGMRSNNQDSDGPAPRPAWCTVSPYRSMLHPAHDGTVRRVDRYDFNSFPITTGQEDAFTLPLKQTASARTCGTLPPAPLSSAESASLSITNGFPTPRAYPTTPDTASPINASPDGCFCRRSPAAPATLSRS